MFSQQIWSLSLQLDWRSKSRWDTLLSVSLAMGLQMCKITPGFYVDARHPNSGPQTCTGRTVLPEPSSQPFNAVFILLHHCRCSLINFFSTHNIPDRLRDLELKYPKFPFLRFVLFYICVCMSSCRYVHMWDGCLRKSEGVRTVGAGVTGVCEPVGSKIWILVLRIEQQEPLSNESSWMVLFA